MTTRVEASSRSSAKRGAEVGQHRVAEELRRSGRVRVTVATDALARERDVVGHGSPQAAAASSAAGSGSAFSSSRSRRCPSAIEPPRAREVSARRAIARHRRRQHLVEEAHEGARRVGGGPRHSRGRARAVSATSTASSWIQRRAVQHRLTPAVDERPLPLEAQRARAEPRAAGPGATRGGSRAPLWCGRAGRAWAALRGQRRSAQRAMGRADRRGQDAVDLVEVGLEIVGDDQRCARSRALLARMRSKRLRRVLRSATRMASS